MYWTNSKTAIHLEPRLRRATAAMLVLVLVSQFFWPLPSARPALAFSNSWPFTTAGEYSYDSAKIQVTGGEALLGRSPTWWDTSYAYRQRITVTAGTTAITTNDTITVNMDTAALVTASKMQADRDDLRMVYWNGSTNTNIDRDYLAEGLGNPTANNDIRFKAQAAVSAAGSDNGYYLYYGNGAATAGPQNPANVYVYYQTFSTDVCASTWTCTDGSWSSAGGIIDKTADGSSDDYAYENTTGFALGGKWMMETSWRRTSNVNTVSPVVLHGGTALNAGWFMSTSNFGSVARNVEIRENTGLEISGSVFDVTNDTWYRGTLRFQGVASNCSGAQFTGYINGTQYVNGSENDNTNCPAGGLLYPGVHTWTAQGEWDNYKVWAYLAESIGFGSEETTYPPDDPTVTPILSTSFVTLSSFSETSTLNGGAIRYLTSNDNGSTWLYHNGAAWVSSNGSYAQANTAAEINTNASAFPTGGGSFVFRAFLHSNGTQLVRLDNVTINGNRAPNVPTLTSPANGGTATTATPTLQLAATDDDSDALQYQIQIDTSSAFNTANLQTYNQATSQTGWSGQNALASTGYASGTTASFTVPSALTAASTYYWRARATDPSGANTASAYSATSSFNSVTAISTVVATAVASRVIVITWTTNQASTSQVSYGLTTSYGQTASDATLTTSHSMTISGLEPNTLYHYQVSSTGNSTMTDGDRTITTRLSTPTILDPVSGRKFASIQTIPIIGLAGSGQTVSVYLDGTLAGTTTARTTTTGTGDFVYRLHNLAVGTHTVAVGASTSTNTSITDNDLNIHVVRPSTAPTFLPPIVTDGLRPKMTIRGLAPSGAEVAIRLNNIRLTTVRARHTSTGVGDFQITLDTQVLRNGTYTITGIGYDGSDIPSPTKTATIFQIGNNRLVRPKSSAGFIHYVDSAENLWSLARQFYGDSRQYTKLAQANNERFPSLATNPAALRLGWRLVIPK